MSLDYVLRVINKVIVRWYYTLDQRKFLQLTVQTSDSHAEIRFCNPRILTNMDVMSLEQFVSQMPFGDELTTRFTNHIGIIREAQFVEQSHYNHYNGTGKFRIEISNKIYTIDCPDGFIKLM